MSSDERTTDPKRQQTHQSFSKYENGRGHPQDAPARGSHSEAATPQHTGYRTHRIGRDSAPDNVENRVVGLASSRRCTSDRIDSIAKIPPDREHSTRSEGVDSSRSRVTPDRPQAPSRRLQPVTCPVIADDAPPAFFGAPPGNPAPVRGLAPVREHNTRGNAGVLHHEDPPFGVLPLMRSTCWAQRRPAWCIPRARTTESVR